MIHLTQMSNRHKATFAACGILGLLLGMIRYTVSYDAMQQIALSIALICTGFVLTNTFYGRRPA